MSSKYQNKITGILKRIRNILKEYSLRRPREGQVLVDQINALREIVEEEYDSSQKIVKDMIGDSVAERQIRHLLWRKLTAGRKPHQVEATAQTFRRRSTDHYKLAVNSLPALIKDVVENSRLIEEELINLTHNLQAIPKATGPEAPSEVSLFSLLRMAMDDPAVEFSEQISQLLFRAYILEESVSLVFAKALKIFNQLAEKLLEEDGSCFESVGSEKTGKRSALSQSLQVFKRNQLRMEMLKLEPSTFDSPPKQAQIQTDYKMVRNPQRTTLKAERRINCCF